MKKMLVVLMLILGWSVSFAQQEVIYGTPRADGYDKITKGAFWSTRPEAKMVEEGSIPPGCTVDVLTEQYYVRFVDTEHNQNDDNYIIFPVGAKIYTKGGKYYSAKCGNEIEYLRPVNMVKIVEKEKVVEVEKPAPKPESKPVVNDTIYQKTTILEEEYIHNVQIAESYPDYYGMSILGWLFMPRMNCYYPCYDRGVYNTYVNNYGFYGVQGNHRPSTPPPHRYMGGGRVDPPVTDNHRYMGGGRGNDTYNTGEGGGRSDGSYTTGQGGGRSAVVSRDGMGRITNSQVSSINNRRVNTSSNNPTINMVSRNSSNYSSSINTRLANRISGGTYGYTGGSSRRISSGSTMMRSSFNPSSIRTSSGVSGRSNGLMRSPMGGRR